MNDLCVRLSDDEIMIREGFKRIFDWQVHGCEAAEQSGDGDSRALIKVFKKAGSITHALPVPAGFSGGR